MFYSQFILAKKGPLGTIWIAAHLERKLKKNQVADTDIGDSVDSILFPDVPIALRLSSHLLLGVVRIYSRKVNYLFHDCSEALLKVKQAFRSTAVDLPPEESTAPYHSITLPETFDLDDFELPDSALLSGNFDDRHVSTREQITLQDTLDGTGYSTSQFGLDERFGDGDASQIGLDLYEELLLNSNLTLQNASVLDSAHQGEGATDHTKMDIDEGRHGCDEDRNDESSKELSELLCTNRGKHVVFNVENVNRNDDSSHRLIFNIQTPDLNEVFLPNDHIRGPSAAHDSDMDFAAADPTSPEFNESANFPSTPGLLEEAIHANSLELPASNPQNISPYTALEEHKLDKPINQEVECPDATNDGLVNAASTSPKSSNLAQVVSSPTSVLAEPKPDSVIPLNNAGHEHDSANTVPVVASSTSILTEITPPASQSLGGTLAGHDATNNSNLVPVESIDSKVADISQVLPSSTLILTEPGSDTLLPQSSGETIAAPGVGCLKSTLRTAETLHAGIICDEANAQPVSMDNSPVSGMASGIDRIPLEYTTGLSNLDQGHVEEAQSCLTSKFSALNSDFHLRYCTSESNQANLISPEDMVQERAQGFSCREQPCNLETQLADQEMHYDGSSMDLQAISTGPIVGVDQTSNDMLLGLKSGVGNPVELSSNCISKDVQSGHGNCFSSSGFSEPERMRFAPSGNVNLSNDLVQQTTEKGLIESDGSVDRISNLCGQKHHLLDSTPDMQNDISPKMSGIPRKKRKNDYVPDDDDLLASILVGRKTPALRIGPTPPLPKPPSLKRPRLTTKVGLPKRRKVLLDDTIVLHADAIRQQLINTEDIRRTRKKVPCTRPEIWRIQKSSPEDDIFCESIFTGVSKELNRLRFQINGQHSSGEAAKELELSKSSVSVRDNDGREMAEQSALGHSGVELITHAAANSGNECLVPSDSRTEEKHADICVDPEQNSLNKIFRTSHELAEVNNNILHVADCTSLEDFTSADRAAGGGIVDNTVLAASNNDSSLQAEDYSNVKAVSITVDDIGVDIVNVTNLDLPQDGPANIRKDENGGTAVSMLDRFIVEVGTDFPADSSTLIGYANSSVQDTGLVDGGPVSSNYQAMKESEGKVTQGYETVVDEERTDSEFPCGERHNMVSFPFPTNTESECVPSAVGENSCMNIEGGVDVESTPMELAATREPSDFCSAIDDIDTDFLNVDDEVGYDEETNNDVPNTEEAQSLENSGWSSRTRGVARYLKNMFDQESGRGRKSVAIDHLLASKTRKEASRMFFETLVLKTRDYIHVEQANPFDCVNIKPRIKLLKSAF